MTPDVTRTIDLEPAVDRIPVDRFGVRLAMIRAEMGWNMRDAANACGINETAWARWERGGSPEKYEATCRQIADASGYSLAWLKAGGPLDSRCIPAPNLRLVPDLTPRELPLEWTTQ